MDRTIGSTTVRVIEGNIIEQAVDAIVNAANSSLMGGGGVDGAIHRAGGPAILEECKTIRAQSGRLPTGQAVITTGGALAARHVIHTVGPIWRGSGAHGEHALLESAYRESLRVAIENGLRTVAFPSISTGAYGFPVDQAAEVAARAIIQFVEGHPAALDEVRMVLFSADDYRAYEEAFVEALSGKLE